MPRKYKPKPGVVPRHINWTEASLALAFEELNKKEKGVNEICRIYGIPPRTLRRRYEKKNQQLLTQGKYPVLGFENEKRLVTHILKLGDSGFPPERISIRLLAYQFAEKLELKHNFNNETQMAGPQWLQSFLERNTVISVRQSEGLSLERAKGLNRAEVAKFFTLLTTVLTENNLLDKPDRIFNMDESGVQLNNKPGKVLAKKGARAVKSLTSGEKGETITVVGCCNAIGNFLPPVLILKGVNKKPEFEEGLPPGSKVYMHKKSAYISSDLFYKWLTEHFIFHKPQGKVLLILDGHSSHSSAVNMLEAARDNDVILLCLPSHTTSALQPLDKSVFGPFKKFYNAETNHFMRTNPQKKLNRYNSGQLIGKAWIRAATLANAISGFRGSGIYPVNPNALSDAEFAISDIALDELAQERESNTVDDQIPGVSGEPALQERSQEFHSELRLAPNERDQASSLGDQVLGVPRETSLDERAQELDSELRIASNERDQALSLGDQVPGVSGETALGERAQESDSELRLAPNEHDQAPSLSKHTPGVCKETTLGDRAQDSESEQRLATNKRDRVPPLGNKSLGVSDEDELETVLYDTELSEHQHHTPPRPSPSLLNLSQDCLAQIDIDIENYILDGTELSLPSLVSLNESNKSQRQNIEKETPSKFLHQSSPIPKIPISMSKRAKQSAEILNSNKKIDQKKNKEEKGKKKNSRTETKIGTTKQKRFKTENKLASRKTKIMNKRIKLKEKKQTKKSINISSSESETEFKNTDFIKLNAGRALRKRRVTIYSSDSENEENVINTKTHKGKATDGLQIKKSKKGTSITDTEEISKVTNANLKIRDENEKISVDDYCVECFENYNFTKSKSDWIACALCRMWLHETCTSFKEYCTRCGKLKALVL